jgi:hypothetical protein
MSVYHSDMPVHIFYAVAKLNYFSFQIQFSFKLLNPSLGIMGSLIHLKQSVVTVSNDL